MNLRVLVATFAAGLGTTLALSLPTFAHAGFMQLPFGLVVQEGIGCAGFANSGLSCFIPDTTAIVLKENLTGISVDVNDNSGTNRATARACVEHFNASNFTCGARDVTLAGGVGYDALTLQRNWVSGGQQRGLGAGVDNDSYAFADIQGGDGIDFHGLYFTW
jgi:hypothetical protein